MTSAMASGSSRCVLLVFKFCFLLMCSLSKRRGTGPRVLYRCAVGHLGPAGKRCGMERAGTLSIPYGKQAAFAGRLGLTGDVRPFRIKNAGAPFRSHQRLIG